MTDLDLLRQQYAEMLNEVQPTHIVGVDEVGFGAMAGPCTIGGVGVPVRWMPPVGLTDSKLLTARERNRLSSIFLAISDPEIVHGIYDYSSEEIDRRGLGKCRTEGLVRAVTDILEKLPKDANVLAIVDGNLRLPNSRSIPKADVVVPVVSMASVLAKVSRDTWMTEVDAQYPGYRFGNHKGYDTKDHREALVRLGPCPIHRRSNATVIRSSKPPQEDITSLLDSLS